MRTFLLALAFFAVLGAHPAAARGPKVTEDPVHEELRVLRTQALEAIAKNDLPALLKLCHKDVAFTTTNGEIARGHEAVSGFFNKMMSGPEKIVNTVAFDMEADALSVMHGDDTAIGYGKSTDTYSLTNGETFVLHTRWSATLVKEGSEWKIASFHSSVNVFDNAMLTATKSVIQYFGAGGLVAGLLLGLLGGFVAFRKKAG
jgi:uncharacterized protein (TIGR02246 family)